MPLFRMKRWSHTLSKRLLQFGVLAALAASFLIFYRANYEVPILMYHRVDDFAERSSIMVSSETFERQMEFLKVHHYNVLPLSDILACIKSGKKLPPKSVSITFDDGYLDNIKNAFPVLRKMGFPATVFMITSNIGKENWLSAEDLRILDEAGVSIGSHTANHAFLPSLDSAAVEAELKVSKKNLEDVLGHPATLFSYPAGGFTPRVRSLVEGAGYEGAVTTNHGKDKHDPYALHRVKITEAKGNLFNFWAKTSGMYQTGKKRAQASDMRKGSPG